MQYICASNDPLTFLSYSNLLLKNTCSLAIITPQHIVEVSEGNYISATESTPTDQLSSSDALTRDVVCAVLRRPHGQVVGGVVVKVATDATHLAGQRGGDDHLHCPAIPRDLEPQVLYRHSLIQKHTRQRQHSRISLMLAFASQSPVNPLVHNHNI